MAHTRVGIQRSQVVEILEREIAKDEALGIFIDVRLYGSTDLESFAQRLSASREVADTVHMTGSYDALVRAFVLDTGAIDVFLGRLKRECRAGQIQTSVAPRSGAKLADRATRMVCR